MRVIRQSDLDGLSRLAFEAGFPRFHLEVGEGLKVYFVDVALSRVRYGDWFAVDVDKFQRREVLFESDASLLSAAFVKAFDGDEIRGT